jgi:hypothetical protein
MASSFIREPGLYYDEVLFVNAALGGINSSFIYKKFLEIPIMLMPYIGALKAYIYYPIFKLFGVSPDTIRLPAIIISSISIWISFMISRHIFDNKWIVLACVATIATDPTFIFMSKLDYGPVVLMIFLKLLVILFFFNLIETFSLLNMWLIVILCLLGIYNKLDFIWFIIAFCIATLVFWDKLIAIYNKHRYGFLTSLSVLVAGVFIAFVILIVPLLTGGNKIITINLLERIPRVFYLYRITMDGQSLYNFITNSHLHVKTMINLITLVALFSFGILGLIAVFKQNILNNFKTQVVVFFLIASILIFIQIMLTNAANGSHHIMMIWPFHIFFIFSVISLIIGFIGRYFKKTIVVLMIIVFIVLIGSEINTSFGYYDTFKNNQGFNPLWDNKIYQLINYIDNYTKNVSINYIISVDWGINNQVFSLVKNKERAKCLDLWPTFNELLQTRNEKWLYQTYFAGKTVLILLHSSDDEVMPNARKNFFIFSKSYLKSIKLIKVFKNKQKIIYEVYYYN